MEGGVRAIVRAASAVQISAVQVSAIRRLYRGSGGASAVSGCNMPPDHTNSHPGVDATPASPIRLPPRRTTRRGFDYYRERGESAMLFAEPINVLSNIAFFAAAFIATPFCRTWFDWALAIGCFMVGLGSTAYHSYPTRWTHVWDISSIVAWVLLYLFCWSHYIMGLAPWPAAGAVAAFVVLSMPVLKRYSAIWNGSGDYTPVIIVLVVCGGLQWWKDGQPHLVLAAILACFSLFCRAIDNSVRLSSGTHFLWHTLNGFLMALLTLFMCTQASTQAVIDERLVIANPQPVLVGTTPFTALMQVAPALRSSDQRTAAIRAVQERP